MTIVVLESVETDLKRLKSYVVKKFGKEIWAEGFNEIKTFLASVADGAITGKIPPELSDLNDKSTVKCSRP